MAAAVLPVLSDSVRTTGHPRSITLVLIDPTDKAALEAYAEFKLGIAQTASKTADQHLARWVPPLTNPKRESIEEIAAKILSAIYLSAFSCLQSGMNVSICLRGSFTPFRADMTDREVVLTQESQSDAAVAFSSSGHFYGWYHKEADAQRIQATKLEVSGAREELRKLGLAHPSSSKSELKVAIRAVALHFSHLAQLAADTRIVELAARHVSRPTHAYK